MRIVSTGPTSATAMVLVDGVPLDNVMSVQVVMRADHMNTAVIELDGVEVDIEAEVSEVVVNDGDPEAAGEEDRGEDPQDRGAGQEGPSA